MGMTQVVLKVRNPQKPSSEFKGDSLLLGTFTLEALGLTLDPFKRRLYKAILRM